MPRRLPVVSGGEAVKAFELGGWTVKRRSSSHIIMTKAGIAKTLSIPNHRELKRGTLRGLIRDAGLTVDEFIELLGSG